jgi:hypothetical protein
MLDLTIESVLDGDRAELVFQYYCAIPDSEEEP